MIFFRNEATNALINLSRCTEVYVTDNRVMAELGNGRKIPLALTRSPEEAAEVFGRIISGIGMSIGDTLIRIGEDNQ